jgi:hypothetical protein
MSGMKYLFSSLKHIGNYMYHLLLRLILTLHFSHTVYLEFRVINFSRYFLNKDFSKMWKKVLPSALKRSVAVFLKQFSQFLEQTGMITVSRSVLPFLWRLTSLYSTLGDWRNVTLCLANDVTLLYAWRLTQRYSMLGDWRNVIPCLANNVTLLHAWRMT